MLNVTCCFVQCKSHWIAIVSLYCSPSTCPTTALNDLNNVMLALADHTKHFIIAGDLNINLLADSAIKAQYLSLLEDFYLVQLLSEPTRVTSNSSTLIDHIITTKQTSTLRMVQTCGVSDHCVQIANFDFQEFIKFVHLGSVIGIILIL